MKRTLFIAGTDTGVGKTVLSVLLTRFLLGHGVNVAALKPICSGGRGDARALRSVLNGALSLDEINPWHFRAPIAPLLAARRERKRVALADVLAHVRAMHKRFDVVLIEGAGGLLSPLGAFRGGGLRPSHALPGLAERRSHGSFDSRDLIVALRAAPIVVCPNRLGAANQVRLTLEALPESFRARAQVVLTSPPKPDAATGSNAKLLAEFPGAAEIFTLPWLGKQFELEKAFRDPQTRRTLRHLAT